MMRALSLTQPWASLMAWGEKRYETRDWSTAIRGEVAIVSSKGFPRESRELCYEEPFGSVLRAHGVEIVSTRPSGPTQLPLGVVLAVLRLVDDAPVETVVQWSERAIKLLLHDHFDALTEHLANPPGRVDLADHELAFGDYSAGRRALITTGVIALKDPIPVERIEKGVVKPGGALGFYVLSPACEAAVRAQLAQAEVVP
jgi:hypothetical protein